MPAMQPRPLSVCEFVRRKTGGQGTENLKFSEFPNSISYRRTSMKHQQLDVVKERLVRHGGFEPSTLRLEVSCSIQLS